MICTRCKHAADNRLGRDAHCTCQGGAGAACTCQHDTARYRRPPKQGLVLVISDASRLPSPAPVVAAIRAARHRGDASTTPRS